MKKKSLQKTTLFIKKWLKPSYLTIIGVAILLSVGIISVVQVVKLGQLGGPLGSVPSGTRFEWWVAQKGTDGNKLTDEKQTPSYEQGGTILTVRREHDGSLIAPFFGGKWVYSTPPPVIDP